MKTSRAQVEQNRENLLKAASEGFRRKGFDGIRLAEIMHDVGLTHGGFYNYFASKDDLVASACERSLAQQSERLKAAGQGDPAEELPAYFRRYLTMENRDNPAQACLFPSLAAEIARQGAPVRQVFTEGLTDYLGAIAALSDREKAGDELPQNAVAILSTLVGAMVLARGTDDRNLAQGILEAARQALENGLNVRGSKEIPQEN